MAKAICEYCGEEFSRSPKHLARKKHNFCSRECFGKYRTTTKEVTCDCCGEVFMKRPCEIEKTQHNFCSRKCFSEKIMKGQSYTKTHGMTKHPLGRIYNSMKDRCYNENCKDYRYYGERGIGICDEWLEDRTRFFDWAFANGWEKGLTLDKIDNDGMYSPDNCQWITQSENSKKKRIDGKRTLTLGGWASKHHIGYRAVKRMIKDNLTTEEIQAYINSTEKERLNFWRNRVRD